MAQVEGELNLTQSRIGGNLVLTATAVRGEANMSGIRVRGLLNAERLSAELLILGSRVGAPASRFHGGVHLLAAKIGTDLDLTRALVRNGAGLSRWALNLSRAEIRGRVELTGVRLAGGLIATSLSVGGDLRLGDIPFSLDAPIHGLVRARLHDVVLVGARVDGDLVLMGPSRLWRQRADASMRLTNTRVGGLDDWRDAWPPRLDLDGFAYTRMGPQHPYALDAFGERDTRWLLAWLNLTREQSFRSEADDARTLSPARRAVGSALGALARRLPGRLGGDLLARSLKWSLHFAEMDRGFRPETYERLARALRASQRHEAADGILFEAREKARRNAPFPRSLWLWLSRVLIGYGIGAGYFRAAGFALAAAVLGVLVILLDGWVLGFDKALQDKDATWLFFASFDHLLPIVTLDKEFELIPHALRSTSAKLYFWLLGIAGWVLGSFLIAGLAGVTQKS
jgi:hypothetical protein